MLRVWRVTTPRCDVVCFGSTRLRSTPSMSSMSGLPSGGARRRSNLTDATGPVKPKQQPTASASSSSSSATPVTSKRKVGRMERLIRERGVPFAIYWYVFVEAVTIVLAIGFQYNIIGTGDLVAWLKYVGLGSYVDIERHAGRHATILGYEVSARMAMNYCVASACVAICTPLTMGFCAYTLPGVMTVCRAIKPWGRTSKPSIPKAPAAAPTASDKTSKLTSSGGK